jgi:hypothetical protein
MIDAFDKCIFHFPILISYCQHVTEIQITNEK